MMKIRHSVWGVFAGFLFMAQSANAQVLDQMNFELMDEESGLSNRNITSMVQDKTGFIWIGTRDGLNRYDGSGFKVFKNRPEDSSSLINDFGQYLTVDPKGNVWICYNSAGLSRYREDCQCFEHYDLKDSIFNKWPKGFSILQIDMDQTIWIGSTGLGLTSYNLQTHQSKHWDLPDIPEKLDHDQKRIANTVNHIYDSGDGILWLATSNGLYSLDRQSNKLFNEIPDIYNSPNYKTAILVKILPQRQGGFWISSFGGMLYYFDPCLKQINRYSFYHINQNSWLTIYDLAEKSADELWITATTKGVGIFNTKTKKFYFRSDKKNENSQDDISTAYKILKTKENILFITSLNGLIKYNPRGRLFQFQSLTNINQSALGQFRFSDIVEDSASKVTLISTLLGNGLNVLDHTTGKIKNYLVDIDYEHKDVAPRIVDILLDRNHQFWILSIIGLYRFEPKSKKLFRQKLNFSDPELKNQRLGKIFEDQDGEKWIITQEGFLCKFIEKTLTLKYTNGTNPNHWKEAKGLTFIIDGHDHQLWMGNRTNLFLYDKLRDTLFRPLDSSFTKLISNGIGGYTLDSNKNLWLSVFNKGIIKISTSPNQDFKTQFYDTDNGLLTNKNYHIYSDHLQRIWVASLRGIYLFNPITKTSVLFNRSEGMENYTMEMQFHPSKNNILYLTIPYKYCKVDFNLIDQVSSDPIIYLDKFTLRQQAKNIPLVNHTHIVLRPQENFFAFDFGAIDFSNQTHNKYAYQLVNWDADWVQCGNRKYASYTNLNPGNYIFQVKVAGANGIFGNPLQIHLQLESVYYKKPWFIILCVLGFLGLIVAIYWYRVNQIRKTEKLKTAFNTQLAELRMEALRAQMNPHFIFNCLNSINRYIIKSDVKTSSLYLTRFAKLMRIILDNSEHKKVILSNELEALNLYIEMESMRFEHRFNYEIMIDPDVETDHIEIPPLIIQPYVENAIWHGLLPKESPGKLTIHISRNQENLILEITDNGIGREQSKALKSIHSPTRKSLGMKLTEERLQMASQNISRAGSQKIIDLLDRDGNAIGTNVMITLPIE